jgi:hypothetical protein
MLGGTRKEPTMADKRNPTATDLLVEALLPGIIESIVDDAASISVEDAEKELTEAGFDVVDGHADAEMFLAELKTGTLGARWGVDREKKRT